MQQRLGASNLGWLVGDNTQSIYEAIRANFNLLDDDFPGGTEAYPGVFPYYGGIVYLALKSEKVEGAWSKLYNIAFWPSQNPYLPAAFR